MLKKFDLANTPETVNGLSVQVVNVQGYLDSSTFPQLQDHLQEQIEKKEFRIIIEFGDLNYISSAGLGVLMGTLQIMRDNGGDLKLANMSSKIRNLFDMLGFSRLIRIYDDLEMAKQAFIEDQSTEPDSGESVRAEDEY